MQAPLISVIIPCYNQAHFLGEAIESVLAQSHPNVEIVVIDDGSTDNTAGVAANYSNVRYIRQANQGLSAARNTGIHHSIAGYLVFLDADDRLLPNALKSGLQCLNSHLECAFAYGRYRLIAADGSELPPWPQHRVEDHHYIELLQGNYIGMHATVMYRHEVFQSVGGFNISLRACEDYDLYLRITKQFPIVGHNEMVAEYRKHGTNMTFNSRLMLLSSLGVLRSQWRYVQGNPRYEEAYRIGVKFWRGHYSRQSIGDMLAHLKARSWRKAWQAGAVSVQYALPHSDDNSFRILKRIAYWLSAGRQRLTRLPVGRIDLGGLRRVTPLNHKTGRMSQPSIERYYLNRFLYYNAGDIRGHVLEVGDGSYTRQFDTHSLRTGNGPQVTSERLKVTTVDVDDLSSVDEMLVASFDCIILPHILHRIYDIKVVTQTFYRLLKPGGAMLATFPGINLNNQAETSYWAFTGQLVRRLFSETFQPADIAVGTYGNALAATAFLHGLAASELRPEELDYQDPHYQILIGLRAIKPVHLQEA